MTNRRSCCLVDFGRRNGAELLVGRMLLVQNLAQLSVVVVATENLSIFAHRSVTRDLVMLDPLSRPDERRISYGPFVLTS